MLPSTERRVRLVFGRAVTPAARRVRRVGVMSFIVVSFGERGEPALLGMYGKYCAVWIAGAGVEF